MLYKMFKNLYVITFIIGIVSSRHTNDAGLALIKKYEGFEANFYNDPAGIKAIGYGHTCNVNDCSKITAPITEAQASQLLVQDLATPENCVQNQVSFVNDNQFAALVSLTYTFNVGCTVLEGSALLKDVKAKDFTAAADQFGANQFVQSGGKVLEGLVKRSAAEKELFLKAV